MKYIYFAYAEFSFGGNYNNKKRVNFEIRLDSPITSSEQIEHAQDGIEENIMRDNLVPSLDKGSLIISNYILLRVEEEAE